MNRSTFGHAAPAILLLAAAGVFAADEPRQRTFDFTYQGAVAGVPEGKRVRVWLPVPASNADQQVEILKKQLPARARMETDKQYGNRMFYFEAGPDAAGKVPFAVTYRVTRREVKGPIKQEDDLLERFLKPDKRVPIAGKPLELIKGKDIPKDPLQAARLFYDVVDKHMRYSKEGTGWGQGDSAWACGSGFGNCSDFHSLFISLARGHKIPARFEIGFPLPEQRGQGKIPGYHCWAKFKPAGQGWIAVDISEASKNPKLRDYYFGNLTENRVAFTLGRDLTLAPKQAGPPLNFLIYPYAEIDGKPVAADKIDKRFSFKDVQR